MTWTGRVDWSERLVKAGTPVLPGAVIGHWQQATYAPTHWEHQLLRAAIKPSFCSTGFVWRQGLDVFSQKTCLPAHAIYNSTSLVIMGKCIIWSVTSWSVDWQFRCSAAPPIVLWKAAKVERKRYVPSLYIGIILASQFVAPWSLPFQSSKIITNLLLGASCLLSSAFSFSLD